MPKPKPSPPNDSLLDFMVSDRRYASPEQVEYIEGLLEKKGVEFAEACHDAWLVAPKDGPKGLEIGEASELIDYLKGL